MSITFDGFIGIVTTESRQNDDGIMESVLCAFETDRFGIVQVGLKLGDESGQAKIKTPMDEPDLEMFTKKEQIEMEKWCLIVAQMIFNVPAATDRFE